MDYDPYSASKGAAEFVVSSWRNSFFHPDRYNEHKVKLASARAGNVIGGGDWSKDRILPDCMRALQQNKTIEVRNPLATRPWQHVLESLGGYLLLGAKLMNAKNEEISGIVLPLILDPIVIQIKQLRLWLMKCSCIGRAHGNTIRKRRFTKLFY